MFLAFYYLMQLNDIYNQMGIILDFIRCVLSCGIVLCNYYTFVGYEETQRPKSQPLFILKLHLLILLGLGKLVIL